MWGPEFIFPLYTSLIELNVASLTEICLRVVVGDTIHCARCLFEVITACFILCCFKHQSSACLYNTDRMGCAQCTVQCAYAVCSTLLSYYWKDEEYSKYSRRLSYWTQLENFGVCPRIRFTEFCLDKWSD